MNSTSLSDLDIFSQPQQIGGNNNFSTKSISFDENVINRIIAQNNLSNNMLSLQQQIGGNNNFDTMSIEVNDDLINRIINDNKFPGDIPTLSSQLASAQHGGGVHKSHRKKLTKNKKNNYDNDPNIMHGGANTEMLKTMVTLNKYIAKKADIKYNKAIQVASHYRHVAKKTNVNASIIELNQLATGLVNKDHSSGKLTQVVNMVLANKANEPKKERKSKKNKKSNDNQEKKSKKSKKTKNEIVTASRQLNKQPTHRTKRFYDTSDESD